MDKYWNLSGSGALFSFDARRDTGSMKLCEEMPRYGIFVARNFQSLRMISDRYVCNSVRAPRGT